MVGRAAAFLVQHLARPTWFKVGRTISELASDLFDFWSYQCPKCEAFVKVVKPHEARSLQ